MGNATTHIHYTTSNNSSTLHPSTPPEPYRTHQQLALAELITPARKTIAQLARSQHPYPNTIPNRYFGCEGLCVFVVVLVVFWGCCE